MLTKKFFFLFIACIAVALLGMHWDWCLQFSKIGVIALGALAVLDALFLLFVSFRLRVRRSHHNYFSLNQHNPVKLSVELLLPENVKKLLNIQTFDDLPASFKTVTAPFKTVTAPFATHSASGVPTPSLAPKLPFATIPEASASGNAKDGFRGLGDFSYSAVPLRRGSYKINLTRCFLRTKILGLVEVRRFFNHKSSNHQIAKSSNETIKVYPSFKNLDKLEIQATSQEKNGPKRMRRKGNSTAFDQIRPYISGDDVRTINWKASARAASLMVNTYTDERSQPIIPILCAGPSMQNATEGITLLDRAASAAIALSASAIRHYDEAGLLTLSQRGIENFLAPERSTTTLTKILEHTYKFGLEPSDEEKVFIEDPDVYPDDMTEEEVDSIRRSILVYDAEPDFQALSAYVNKWISRRSLLVLFANFENISMARHIMPELNRISKKHTLLVVLFENEGVKDVAQGYAHTIGSKGTEKRNSTKLSEMRFRTLCNDYLEQQLLLADYMQKQNINVILTSPQDLTSAVLQKYLEMKSRAAI